MSEKRHRIVICVLLVVLAALIGAAVFIGLKVRSSHLEGASITTELDLVDTCIRQGDTKQALSVLSRAEKRAFTVYDRLGIYKRYVVLSETAKAEKCLVKALRKFPNHKDVLAVYGNFLLRQNRVAEAFKITSALSGTDYGSIYAEAVMRKALTGGSSADALFSAKKGFFHFKKAESKKKTEPASDNIFLDRRFIPVYTDAYRGTGISRWIVNAATLLMMDGKYADAALLCPQEISSVKDALFWGIVLYDGARYAESLSALLQADALEESLIKKDIASAVELKSLESDDYYILGDDDSAQKMRAKILDASSPYMQAYIQNRTPILSKLLPLLYMNSALYEKNTGNILEQYNRLYELVTYYPEYEPGLAAYGEYAIESLRRPEEDELYRQLRDAGLRTVGMENRDAIPVVPLEDVLSRIDEALKDTKSADLIVLKEEILAERRHVSEKNEKASYVWKLLEGNEISAALYPPEVMHYAVLTLIENADEKSAEPLFNDYLAASYGRLEDGSSVHFEPALQPERMRLWECEIAAYFAVRSRDFNAAKKLYTFLIDTYAPRTAVMNTAGQNSAVVSAYVNLGTIFSGFNDAPQALSLLNKAVARVTDHVLKAEILYRIAVESYAMGRNHDAQRSLQYALSLNPSHNRARFLMKQIQNKK